VKKNKQIIFILRSSSFLFVLISLSLNVFSSNNTTKTFSKSITSNEISTNLQGLNHASYNSNVVQSINNFCFELEEDDDDTKSHPIVYSFCTQIKSYNFDVLSGFFYLKTFLFYEKTPRFILYKNFKDFLF
jgi:hypothetical protein